VLSLILHDESHGSKISKLYRKFILLLNCSKMGRVYIVWWMRVVDSHPVINNSIAITIIVLIKYWDDCVFHKTVVTITTHLFDKKIKMCAAAGIVWDCLYEALWWWSKQWQKHVGEEWYVIERIYKCDFLKSNVYLMFIGPRIIAIVEEWKTNLMSFAILFHLLCAQHVSDINISIFRSLRLCW